MKELQGKILAARHEAEHASSQQDYDKAIDQLDYIEAALATYESAIEEMNSKCKAYQEQLKALEPRIAETQPPLPGELPAKVAASIAKNVERAAESAEKQNYDDAIEGLTTTEDSLAGYEKLREQHEERKAAFEAALAALKPRLEAAAKPIKEATMVLMQGKIEPRKEKMEAAATAQDYETAQEHADYLDAALKVFETYQAELEEKRQAYEARLKPMESDIAKTSPPIPGATAQRVAELLATNLGLAKEKAAEEDYDEAMTIMDVLDGTLEGYEELVAQHNERKARYLKKLETLEPRLDEAAEPSGNSKIKTMQSRIAPTPQDHGRRRGAGRLRRGPAAGGLPGSRSCRLR